MRCTSGFHPANPQAILSLIFLVIFQLNFQIFQCQNYHHKVYRRLDKPDPLKFEIKHPTDCSVIFDSGTILNDCGYCVEGQTGLNRNYGKDCQGTCFGNATIDCMGVCGGDAYMDECSELCIKPGVIIADEDKLALLSSNRDCRGMCSQPPKEIGSGPVPIPTQQYIIDQCGICSLSQSPSFQPHQPNNNNNNGLQSPKSTSVSPSSLPLSHLLDCAGNCQLPGLSKHSIVCGKCIRQSDLFNVIDNCGNCITEGHPCSCDRDPIRCGCIDQNNCYIIKSLSPLAVPRNHAVNISVVGYFSPYVNQLYCVVRSQAFEIIESFPVQFLHKNKTNIQCTVQLEQSGEYVLGLGFRKNVLITPPKDLLQLFVFDSQAVNITFMNPQKSFTNHSETELVINFTENNGELPPVPIRCKIIYEDGSEELSHFGVNQNSCLLKKSTSRSKSQIIKIFPTFDGLNLISSGFQHLIEAPAPKIFSLSSFISEDSLSIIVNFDKSVDVEMIKSHVRDHVDNEDDEVLLICDYLLLSDTIEQLSLFDLQACQWATRVQLIISLMKPLSSDSIDIKIKSSVLSEYQQKYPLFNEAMSANISKISSNLNWWSYEPMIAITGPNEISFCGNFALIGHYSSPRGTTEVDFRWDVTGEVSTDLKQYVASSGKSSILLLNAEMFEIKTEYIFILRAFIHARRQTIETRHSLIRLAFEAPNLSIYSTSLLHSEPLHENDPVILFADFRVPDCIYPPQLINLLWKTNDPKVLFPIRQINKRNSAIFTIEPYSVPANHETFFSLNAFIGFYQNQTSKAEFRFKTIPARLKGNPANGINRITIGSRSGLLRINSRNDLRAKRLVYQWTCHETKSGQPCYFNFATIPSGYHRDPILITRDIQTKPDLIMNSTLFLPNNQYLIGLQVFDANNTKISSETEYILLNVVEGVKPQVFVGPVYINGEFLVPYSTRFSTFVIPSGSRIVIQGSAYLESGIQNIIWKSDTFCDPLNWSTDRINEREIHTELILHEDTLMPFGTYNIKLKACSYENECSWAEISLMSAQSTTMCEVQVESYVEFEMTLAIIEKCNIPPSASPITYQLLLEDPIYPHMLPLTIPQLSPVVIFSGAPAPTIQFADNPNLIRVVAKVCDRFETCTLHRSQPVHVENTSNFTYSIGVLLHQARRYYQSGDMMMSLSYLNPIFFKSDTENEYDNLFEEAINSTIEFATSALQLPGLTLSSGHYELVFTTFSHALHRTTDTRLQSKLLDLLNRFFDKAEAYKSMPSIKNIRIVYSNVMNSFVQKPIDRPIDNEFLKNIRETFRRIKKAVAWKIPLGRRIILVAERPDPNYEFENGMLQKIHTAYTEIIHSDNVEDVQIQSRMSINKTISAKVQFGPEIRQKFNKSWNCGQKLPCSSVIQTITVFPNENPFPNNEQAHKLSPIIDITIHAPKTGNEQHIRGLFKASIFELSITGNETFGGSIYTTRCHYFDEATEQWRFDDIHPLGIAYNQAGCWSGHLSSFVVLRVILGISANYVIGVMVACTMGILVMGMMVVFYVQRKQMDASSNSTAVKDATITDRTDQKKKGFKRNKQDTSKKHKGTRRTAKVATEIQSQTILVDD